MKFLRTIRFDASDDHVFDRAAEPGEWAVSGAFEFADAVEGDLTRKARQAFANGFLGLGSFGRSTLAVVSEFSEGERDEVEQALARHFVEAYGAPDTVTALPAAREEVDFVIGLCAEKPVNTVFAVARELDDDGIHEAFREIAAARADDHARVWEIVDDA